jgi:GNAT superfamily N-acetyltransferase
MQAAPFLLRIATSADIEAMHRVRLAVRENRLADPSRVTPDHYRAMLEHRGRGWVYEDSSAPEALAGFGIADNTARNIWALFVQPGYEGRGIGRALHDAMVEWLFAVGDTPIWLTTDPNTRAARFYVAAGWVPDAAPVRGELRFVLEPPWQARPPTGFPRS